MSKHTPGPWKVLDKLGVASNSRKRFSVCTENTAPYQAVICHMDIDSVKVDNSTREANAAHIVRCVNAHEKLVEALKDLLDYVKRMEESDDLEHMLDCPGDSYCVICNARAALALAGK